MALIPMNIRDLKYLVALADYRHFGKAAEACFVSQPALSMQIKKLEKYFDAQLLERTSQSVFLTDLGLTLVEKARCILNQVEELRDIAKLAKDPASCELKIGIIPTIAPYLLPYLIPKLSLSFPKLKIFLIEEQTSLLVNKLKEGKIDSAILALPIAEAGFAVAPLYEEEFLLAVAENHFLAKRKKIKQQELRDQYLLLLEEGHCLRDQALAICQSVNASETDGFRATSLETLRHMVANNVGITLIPKLARKTNDGITYIPFQSPQPTRLVGMLWRKSSIKKLILRDVETYIKKTIADVKMV